MAQLSILRDCATVQMTQGRNTLVEEADWPLLSRYRWCPTNGGRFQYAFTWRLKQMHRFLMGMPKGLYVDHRNGDTFDNRRSNLRICTKAENSHNIRTTRGASKYKGVSIARECPGRPWKAQIHIPGLGRQKNLGRFPTEQEAARAYDEAARRHYGEFACTNAELFGDLG